MNDGPYNWCAQHSAWGSWISGLEHTAKLICFVKDGGRGEGRLLSFRQEPSTWCQERRRCSSRCLCCNPTTPWLCTTPLLPADRVRTSTCVLVCVRVRVCRLTPNEWSWSVALTAELMSFSLQTFLQKWHISIITARPSHMLQYSPRFWSPYIKILSWNQPACEKALF